ncbi:hypothetical protein KAR28_04650 [Candidatus Parcubacteria bacterium]|nr:hypothetical protein [Candidatus Parcubacteria bacterium]
MKIGVKVGSKLVTDEKGNINKEFILGVCQQVAALIRGNHEVFIISSGAVASDPQVHRSKNLRAIVGQPDLMNVYKEFFSIYKIESGQLLLTDEYLVEKAFILKRNLIEAFKEQIVVVMNANDGVDDTELKALEICADNDVLFKLVCLLLNVDLAIIGFDQDGLLDLQDNLVSVVDQNNIHLALSYANGGNNLGHGNEGMKTKISVGHELANKGIKTILAPAQKDNFILRAVAGENFGTSFI